MILPDFDEDFEEFIDLLYAAENILEQIGLKGVFNCFVSSNVFEGAKILMFRIILTGRLFLFRIILDVEMARTLYKNIHSIPENNIKTMHKLGEAEIKNMLENLSTRIS